MLIALDGIAPRVDSSAFVEESARVIGDVHIGAKSSVWFNTVIRGDVFHVRIGERSNIQDNSTIHVSGGTHATIIGNDVTVGHGVILHGCTVADRSLVGIGSIVLDGCEIGEESLIAAGSLLAPRTVVPPRSLVLGQPARVKRPLRDEEIEDLHRSAAGYVANSARYKANASVEDPGK